MSKLFLSFLMLAASCQLSFGKAVDENAAKTAGCNFFQGEGKTVKPSDMALAYQATSVVNGATVTDFYVFNSGNAGFVIVSGDDNIIPVLAYDLSSTFAYSSMYVNVNGWLNTYKKEINAVIENNIIPAAATTQKWNELRSSGKFSAAARTTSTFAATLVRAMWNQTPYVNALCPYDAAGSGLTVTGCVATAMAQVMKYWGWPVTGAGSNSYNSSYGVLSADFGASTYKWDSMPIVVANTNLYVAKLMSDAGISVNMSYGIAESGAFVTVPSSPIRNCAEYALQTYFKYQPSTMSDANRSDYDDSSWIYLIQAEIDAKRPVLYTGDGSTGGHCFIADGYNGIGHFHYNWGWGGYCNGYYSVESLVPGGTDLNNDQTLIIGIQPDTMAIVAPTPPVTAGVKQEAANGMVNIYPNPAADVINIDLNGIKANQIKVTDMEGRVLTSITPVINVSMISVPVNDFAEGIYLVQLQTTSGLLTKKVVVAR